MYNNHVHKPSMTTSQRQSQKFYECKNLLSFHMLIPLSPYKKYQTEKPQRFITVWMN